ncbi:MAG: Arginine/ornithine antiporter ArcD [Verrucomicrobia bacterium]|nr:Arginine/ornithine antiporter ArcD [Verrucomicrobiota bacterium]
MQPDIPHITVVSRKTIWTGRIISGLIAAFFIFSGTMKFVKPPGTAEGFAHLGIPLADATWLGVLELSCTVIYLIPRFWVVGAILLTGYLGGAMLTHLRIGEPVYLHVVMAVLVWGGIWLREPRLRALIPIRR